MFLCFQSWLFVNKSLIIDLSFKEKMGITFRISMLDVYAVFALEQT